MNDMFAIMVEGHTHTIQLFRIGNSEEIKKLVEEFVQSITRTSIHVPSRVGKPAIDLDANPNQGETKQPGFALFKLILGPMLAMLESAQNTVFSISPPCLAIAPSPPNEHFPSSIL